MRGECQRSEYFYELRVADIEAARIGTESRHHQPLAVARKALPRQGAAALVNACGRVQMAGDLAVARPPFRLMAKRQRAERERARKGAADAVRLRIVVAGDPNPVAAALQIEQCGAMLRRQPGRA